MSKHDPDFRSEGQLRVVANFNPSGQATVDIIKSKAAALIDICLTVQEKYDDEHCSRWAALAATAFEEGSMWVVKAVTHEAHETDHSQPL